MLSLATGDGSYTTWNNSRCIARSRGSSNGGRGRCARDIQLPDNEGPRTRERFDHVIVPILHQFPQVLVIVPHDLDKVQRCRLGFFPPKTSHDFVSFRYHQRVGRAAFSCVVCDKIVDFRLIDLLLQMRASRLGCLELDLEGGCAQPIFELIAVRTATTKWARWKCRTRSWRDNPKDAP